MNGITIEIAKQFGFTKTLDLFHFPNQNEPKYLVGLSNPTMGRGLLNARSIFDFEVGDEFHYLDATGIYYYDDDSLFIRRIILAKENINVDSVIYTIDNYRLRKRYYYDPVEGTVSHWFTEERDTIFESYDLTNNPFYDRHPFEASSTGLDSNISYISKNGQGEWFKGINDGPPNSSINWIKYYQDEIGFTYSYYRESPNYVAILNLIYYKKGNNEWGTPIDFVALTPTKEIQNTESSILIYPNPAKDNITISSKDPNQKLQHVQVLNALGQRIANWPCDLKNQLKKSVASFPTGTYWLLVTDADGEVWRMNFVRG